VDLYCEVDRVTLPAGSLNDMRYTYFYGADAVYAGQPLYGMRLRNNYFRQLAVLEQCNQEVWLRETFFL
jgi:putative protease